MLSPRTILPKGGVVIPMVTSSILSCLVNILSSQSLTNLSQPNGLGTSNLTSTPNSAKAFANPRV
ncbi:MAG: hypothetical protein ACTSXD_11875 [Candidatus Heimdallarchaeaceae archaeon]